jgi:23S rRNA (uracil1939-C5)-methyltransferase
MNEMIVDIESLSYGRAGVGRVDGKVLFVEHTAPGDRVRVDVTRDRGSFLEARVLEVLAPSAERVSPPCALVGTCGGCSWQHVEYTRQLDAKRRNVADALKRIGGFSDVAVSAVTPSPEIFGYRNRLKLRFENGRLGFYSAHSHSLVPIDDCMIASERVRAALPRVESRAVSLETRPVRVEIADRGEIPGVVVAINCQGRLRRADARRARAAIENDGSAAAVGGIVMWGRGWRREWGDTTRRHPVPADTTEIEVETRGSSFGQVNTGANRLLVDSAVALVAAKETDHVVDLYAGAGNFALPLAARAGSVTAVENDTASVLAGRESAARLGLAELSFAEATVESWLDRAAKQRPPDRVIVNPPRSGLAGTAERIADLQAAVVVYVSCNPATLARDLRTLAERGYAVADVMPFDLFPHTFHVETVCRTRLT